MLIPSWPFCNNSGEEEGGGEVGKAPFCSSNPPPPPLEYNPLSPDLQIMQCCSHFNWPGRHQREMSSSHSASAHRRFPFSQHGFPLLLCSYPPSRILSTMPPEAWLRQRVGTSCTKEMSHHRRCFWSKDRMKNSHSIRLSYVYLAVIIICFSTYHTQQIRALNLHNLLQMSIIILPCSVVNIIFSCFTQQSFLIGQKYFENLLYREHCIASGDI